MNYLISILVFSVCLTSYGQNILINGSIEDPATLSQENSSTQTSIKGWHLQKENPATYFYDNNAPITNASEGKGMLGLHVYNKQYSLKKNIQKREYIQALFREPLIEGKEYFFSFDLRLHLSSSYAVNSLGCVFLNTNENALNGGFISQSTPDIYLNNGEIVENKDWQKYSVRYKAKGGERSVVFGAFEKSDAKIIANRNYKTNDGFEKTSFYYIDNLLLTEEFQKKGCFYESTVSSYLPKKLTLVLDFSGSMRNNKLLDEIQNGVLSCTEGFRSSDEINIIAFSTETRTLYSGLKHYLTRDSLKKIIDACKISGSTNIHAGLKRGMGYAQDELKWTSNHLILISDGQFTIGKKLKVLLENKVDVSIEFLDLGKNKENGKALEKYDIQYIQTDPAHISTDIIKAAGKKKYANACDQEENRKQPTAYILVLDDSGSMATSEDDLKKYLTLALNNIKSNEHIVVVKSRESKTDIIFSDLRQELTLSHLEKILKNMSSDGGNEIEKGMMLGMNTSTHLTPEGIRQEIIVFSDLDPSEDLNALFDVDYSGKTGSGMIKLLTETNLGLSIVSFNEGNLSIQFHSYNPIKQSLETYESIPSLINYLSKGLSTNRF